MSCVGASPAKTSVALGRAQDSAESEADCGVKWPESLAKYAPDSRSWRTHQCLLFEDLTECLETFPRWGMMHDGELWELAMSAHLIEENESGYWPTPLASDGNTDCQSERRRITPHMETEIKIRLGLLIQLNLVLHPWWIEMLMGWPIGWTDLKPLEMDKFRLWLLSHGKSFHPGVDKH